MSKAQIYLNILNTIQTHKYREKYSLHKMMASFGMLSEWARNSMVRNLIASAIIVKQWKTYQVVEHKHYTIVDTLKVWKV